MPPEKPKWTDVASVSIQVVMLISLISSYFQYQQAQMALEHANNAVEVSATSVVGGYALEIDKTFIEYPEMRPYFYQGRDPAELNQRQMLIAESIADLVLDAFLQYWIQTDHSRELQSPLFSRSWSSYATFVYRNSPLVRERLNSDTEVYPAPFKSFMEGSSSP